MAALRRDVVRAIERAEKFRRRRFSARLFARIAEIISPSERAIVEQAAPVEQGDDDDADDTQPVFVSARERLIRLGLVRPTGT